MLPLHGDKILHNKVVITIEGNGYTRLEHYLLEFFHIFFG